MTTPSHGLMGASAVFLPAWPFHHTILQHPVLAGIPVCICALYAVYWSTKADVVAWLYRLKHPDDWEGWWETHMGVKSLNDADHHFFYRLHLYVDSYFHAPGYKEQSLWWLQWACREASIMTPILFACWLDVLFFPLH